LNFPPACGEVRKKEAQVQDEARTRRAQEFFERLPFCRALGMAMVEAGPGWALLALDWRADLVGDPASGVVHGGVITALLDTSGGASVMLHPSEPAATATIDLRIDYMRPAEPRRRILARSEVYRMTRSVAFVRALAWTSGPEESVATATGAFTVEERRP
jgi:uncharacterized protein (TIGR00369 family)